MTKQIFLTVILFSLLTNCTNTENESYNLWYDKPAEQWEETLPLGNGRLGMMPDGEISTEKIVLNDITLWSGGVQDANNYEANGKLPEIRKLLIEGKNDEAEKLINQSFVCKGEGSGSGNGANVPFGCYQVLATLQIDFDYGQETNKDVAFEDYKRSLSLNDAIANCSFYIDGVNYRREYFSSFGDDINVIRLSADKPGKLSCSISISRPERFSLSTDNDAIIMKGQLNNGTDGNGMKYMVKAKPRLKDGEVNIKNNKLIINKATEVLLFVSAKTNYKDRQFEKSVDEILEKAMATSYKKQQQYHIANYQKMFNRADINLGENSLDHLPTNVRLHKYQKDPRNDNALPALFYQFGRYLTISSTRVGLLPPNLQGLWAHRIQTPWNCDYHLDVNVQMNHWSVEVSNLSELNLPLAELVKGLSEAGKLTAKAYYNANGWVAHVITNIWGYTAPGESASWGSATSGSGWLCNNLWEHYAFTNDIEYLKSIYPILKGSAEFYYSMLVQDPETGWYVTAPSVSPENSFKLPNGNHANVCMGPTIDNQIVRELFYNVIKTTELLDTDIVFSTKLKKRLSDLPPSGRISKDGRIMEWLKDYEEADPQHRHISHLYGLYPANLITLDSTPELAEACKKTLEVRGDDGPSWAIAYKQLFWARLHDGNRAYKLLNNILRPTNDTHINYGAGGGVYPNLLSAGPPFQIDGNFGSATGIAEMLIQSHAGYIELLPALPDNWKISGSIKGLKARGNFTVNFKWKNGKVTEYTILSDKPKQIKIKVNGEVKEVVSKKI